MLRGVSVSGDRQKFTLSSVCKSWSKQENFVIAKVLEESGSMVISQDPRRALCKPSLDKTHLFNSERL